jgi:hypothetical protein
MIPITLTCADYARVMPLATGEVTARRVRRPSIPRNRGQIDMFADEAFRLGLTSRLVTAGEYFEDYLQKG